MSASSPSALLRTSVGLARRRSCVQRMILRESSARAARSTRQSVLRRRARLCAHLRFDAGRVLYQTRCYDAGREPKRPSHTAVAREPAHPPRCIARTVSTLNASTCEFGGDRAMTDMA